MGSYEKRVCEALTEWLEHLQLKRSDNSCFARLAFAVKTYSSSAEASEDGGEGLSRSVWLEVFERRVPSRCSPFIDYGLLVGLLETGGWRTLFETAETARAFVLLAIGYIESHRVGSHTWRATTIQFHLAMVTEAWLDQGIEQGVSTLRDIAAALFGEPWCMLIYDDRVNNELLSDMLAATEPDFLPGRLTVEARPAALKLPDLSDQP